MIITMRSVGALGRLIPKSTGGRVALGGGVAGVAAGVATYRNRSSGRMNQQQFDALPIAQRAPHMIAAADIMSPQQGEIMRQRLAAGNFPTQ